MDPCTAVKCIRQSRDKSDTAAYTIERTCHNKDGNCPFFYRYRVNVEDGKHNIGLHSDRNSNQSAQV